VSSQPAAPQTWTLEHLQAHLQGLVDLELWTLPYYLAPLYSIKDRASDAFRLIEDVVHEEMLHVQLASNIANAFGLAPTFQPPVYEGDAVPHVDFSLDVPNPTEHYAPFSAELGPLDLTRLNTMCLVEYPEWRTEREPDLREDHSDYGSIAEFYDAVRTGMYELRAHIRGGVNQVDEFRFFYNDFPHQKIEHDGDRGYVEAIRLVDLITDQGEGQSEGNTSVEPQHRNTADGFREDWTHFKKFSAIRDGGALPETYAGVPDPPAGSPGHEAQETLAADFAAFMGTLARLFGGSEPAEFGALMPKIGGDILRCWQNGATPRFGAAS
jgi:hypothetical protein